MNVRSCILEYLLMNLCVIFISFWKRFPFSCVCYYPLENYLIEWTKNQSNQNVEFFNESVTKIPLIEYSEAWLFTWILVKELG